MRNFAKDFTTSSNLKMRIFDFIAHCSLGYVLTLFAHLHWYWMFTQWFPDINLLVMWPHGMITKRYLSESNFFVSLHGDLHDRGFWFWLLLCAVVFHYERNFAPIGIIFFFANWLAHLFVDSFTHEEFERNKDDHGTV